MIYTINGFTIYSSIYSSILGEFFRILDELVYISTIDIMSGMMDLSRNFTNQLKKGYSSKYLPQDVAVEQECQ